MTVVDTVDFHCLDWRRWNGAIKQLDKALYSHKMNGPGLRYEIAHGIYTGNICWVNGPFKAGDYNDLQIAQENGLCDVLDACKEKAIADSIYKRDQKHFYTPEGTNTPIAAAANRCRARQEYINALLKKWGCFIQAWRHDTELHEWAIMTALTILQIRIDCRLFKLFDLKLQPPPTINKLQQTESATTATRRSSRIARKRRQQSTPDNLSRQRFAMI